MRVRLILPILTCFAFLHYANAAGQDKTGAGNNRAASIASQSPMVQSARQFLVQQAKRILDPKIRAATLDAIDNPGTCVLHRAGVREAQKSAILRQLRSLGRPARCHLLLTKTLLIVGQEGSTHREDGGPEKVPNFEIHEPKLCAYDKATGRLVGEVALPRNTTGAPMTYMRNGKQFIVVPTGGSNLPAELIALSLP